MEARNTNSGMSLVGRIERKTHDVEDLRDEYPNWDEMDSRERLEATRSVEPVETDSVFNVTTDRFHQYFVDNLDPGQTASKDNIVAVWLALGTDGASGTSTSDTDLNTRTFSKEVTDVTDNGKELFTSTFIDSTEANGDVITELGLFSGDPASIGDADTFLINHAASFSSVDKDNSKTVTFDVTLTFSDT